MTDASNPVNLREATLDEPITTTIMRDVKKVLTKVFHVLVPRTFSRDAQGVSALRDWDLWGPLIICMLLSVFLSMGKSNTEENQNSAVFAASFVIVLGWSRRYHPKCSFAWRDLGLFSERLYFRLLCFSVDGCFVPLLDPKSYPEHVFNSKHGFSCYCGSCCDPLGLHCFNWIFCRCRS